MSQNQEPNEPIAAARNKRADLMGLKTDIQDLYETQIKEYNDITIADYKKNKKQNSPEDKKALNVMENIKALSESIIDPNGTLYGRKRAEKIRMNKRASKIDDKAMNGLNLYFFEQLLEGDRSNFDQIEHMPEVQILNKINEFKDLSKTHQHSNSR